MNDTKFYTQKIIQITKKYYNEKEISTDCNNGNIDIKVSNYKYYDKDTSFPANIQFAIDSEGNFFMNVDSFCWEFDDDFDVASRVYEKYINLMKQNKLTIKRRKINKWVAFGKDLKILE
jgi:hypothetical protein